MIVKTIGSLLVMGALLAAVAMQVSGKVGGQKDTLGTRVFRILSVPPPCPQRIPSLFHP